VALGRIATLVSSDLAVGTVAFTPQLSFLGLWFLAWLRHSVPPQRSSHLRYI
jgi:hypothetical protein